MFDLEDIYQQTLENCPEIIQWAFKNKPKNFYEIKKIFDIEGSCSTVIRSLKILKLAEDLKNANCSNIQEKFADTNTWSKFLSLGSELFFAYEFVKLGFDVSLIPDNSLEWRTRNGQDGKSPDISIKKDGHEFLVEVARINDDETILDIANQINPIIKRNPFCVHIQYSEEFSIPVVSYKERTAREKIIEDFVEQFREIIKTIDPNSLPQIKNILGCEVEFSESVRQQGCYAGCMTGTIINPAERIQPQIKKELERKAKKRQQWNDSQKNLHYLIALDIQQNWFDEDKLIPLLFGGKFFCYLPEILGKPGDELPIVTSAKENGWKDFLENVGFNPRSNSRVCEPGIFINNPIFENVTGVITRIENTLQVVPNPFAEEQINYPDLEKIIPWTSVSNIYKIN